MIDGGRPQVAPSSFGGNASEHEPRVAVATYDPRNGRYLTADGKFLEQSDLATKATPKTWRDMLPT